MIFSELLPEAHEGTETSRIGVVVTLAFTAMMALTLVLG